MKASYQNISGTRFKLTDIGFSMYAMIGPSLEEELEKRISEFWPKLVQSCSDHGIGEILAMKRLLISQIGDLDKDRAILKKELAENMKFILALNHAKKFLNRKIEMIDGFLAIYALQGAVEISDKEKVNLQTKLESAIESVSLAISKSEKSENSFETIQAFLTAYYDFKETSLGLKKIKDHVVDQSNDQAVKDQLQQVSNSTLYHWKKKLEKKIKLLKKESVLYEQKEDDK